MALNEIGDCMGGGIMKNVKFVLIIYPEEMRHEKTVSYSEKEDDSIISCDCFSWVKSIMNWSYKIIGHNGKTGILGYPYKAKLTVDILGGIHHEKTIEIPRKMEEETFAFNLEDYVKSECIEWAENFMDWHVE